VIRMAVYHFQRHIRAGRGFTTTNPDDGSV
jgi:ribosomal protein L13E